MIERGGGGGGGGKKMWLSFAEFSVYHSVFRGVCFVIGVQIDRFSVGGSDDHDLVLQCK